MREALFVLIIAAIVPLTIDAYIEDAAWAVCPTCGNEHATRYANAAGHVVCFKPGCAARNSLQDSLMKRIQELREAHCRPGSSMRTPELATTVNRQLGLPVTRSLPHRVEAITPHTMIAH